MSVLYDLGIVPYGGGTLNITAANSYIHFVDEETFVATYPQTSPYGLIVALGKCVGGFKTGTPEVVYQELISQSITGSPLITKLTPTRFLLSMINSSSGTINMYVFDIVGDTLVQKTSRSLTVSSLLPSISNHTSGVLSVNYGSGHIEDNICYINYATGKNGTTYQSNLYIDIIKYDETSNNIAISRQLIETLNKSNSTTPTTPNPVVKMEVYSNGTNAILVFINDLYGYENTRYTSVATSYTVKARTLDYKSETPTLGATRTLMTTSANGFVKMGNELYVLNNNKTSISKIDGINFENGTIGTLTSTSYSIGGTTANYLEHIVPINSNYMLTYRDILGKQTSTTGSHTFRVIRKNNNIMEATTYFNIAKTSMGYARTLSNITLFEDYFVIPIHWNTTTLSYMVVKP